MAKAKKKAAKKTPAKKKAAKKAVKKAVNKAKPKGVAKKQSKKKAAAKKAPAKKKTAAKKTSVKKKTATKKKVAVKKKIAVQTAPAAKKKTTKTAAKVSVVTRTPAKKGVTITTSKAFTKKQIEKFRSKLLIEKTKVLEEMGELQTNNLKQSISDSSGEVSRYSYHLGDTASLSYGREFSMGLAERQQRYLEQIDDALDRIEDGTYGICKVTGEPIPKERLEEVPVAKYSVRGKEILERKKRAGYGA